MTIRLLMESGLTVAQFMYRYDQAFDWVAGNDRVLENDLPHIYSLTLLGSLVFPPLHFLPLQQTS